MVTVQLPQIAWLKNIEGPPGGLISLLLSLNLITYYSYIICVD